MCCKKIPTCWGDNSAAWPTARLWVINQTQCLWTEVKFVPVWLCPGLELLRIQRKCNSIGFVLQLYSAWKRIPVGGYEVCGALHGAIYAELCKSWLFSKDTVTELWELIVWRLKVWGFGRWCEVCSAVFIEHAWTLGWGGHEAEIVLWNCLC